MHGPEKASFLDENEKLRAESRVIWAMGIPAGVGFGQTSNISFVLFYKGGIGFKQLWLP